MKKKLPTYHRPIEPKYTLLSCSEISTFSHPPASSSSYQKPNLLKTRQLERKTTHRPSHDVSELLPALTVIAHEIKTSTSDVSTNGNSDLG
jgi:hypothetical protein